MNVLHDHSHALSDELRVAQTSPRSLLAMSVGARVAGALGLIALLWLAVAWALLGGE